MLSPVSSSRTVRSPATSVCRTTSDRMMSAAILTVPPPASVTVAWPSPLSKSNSSVDDPACTASPPGPRLKMFEPKVLPVRTVLACVPFQENVSGWLRSIDDPSAKLIELTALFVAFEIVCHKSPCSVRLSPVSCSLTVRSPFAFACRIISDRAMSDAISTVPPPASVTEACPSAFSNSNTSLADPAVTVSPPGPRSKIFVPKVVPTRVVLVAVPVYEKVRGLVKSNAVPSAKSISPTRLNVAFPMFLPRSCTRVMLSLLSANLTIRSSLESDCRITSDGAIPAVSFNRPPPSRFTVAWPSSLPKTKRSLGVAALTTSPPGPNSKTFGP